MPSWTAWLLYFVDLLFNILQFAIIIRALLSWFNPRPDNPLVILLNDITEPILAPLRRIVPRLGMIDITPIVAILLLQVIQRVLEGVIISRSF
ncbi:MAG TPA: YggT family protein [Chloroflexota bacterium]|nr:YggT family protein [Chloroflexota bacterium]